MDRRTKIGLSCGAIAVGIVAIPIAVLCVITAPVVSEVPNPADSGSILFYSEFDLGGSSIDLCVRDPQRLGRQPLRIIEIHNSDIDPGMGEPFWSGDNSVVAVCKERWVEGKNKQLIRHQGFCYAYDFRNHEGLKGKRVELLLAQRGGRGPIIQNKGVWQKMWPLESRPFPIKLSD